MATSIVMPKAGITVESCIIGKWLKNIGDYVAEGDILFDYETDKATFECSATASGTLLAIFYHSGDEVPCLNNVCVVGEPGEDISKFEVIEDKPQEVLNENTVISETSSPELTVTYSDNNDNILVSPKARNLAKKLSINLTDLKPSGPKGRIITRDVVAYSLNEKSGSSIGGRSFDSLNTPSNKGGLAYIEEKPTQIRSLIAKTMYKSINEMAQLTHHHSFDATVISFVRQACKKSEIEEIQNISLNDMIMFAVTNTLKSHEYLNSTFVDGIIRKYQVVNLAMAVDTSRGLMVPVIFSADKLTLPLLARSTKELANSARTGSINPDLLQGGSFTVSNLGAFNVEMFTPIINPPQVAILGVCGITTRIKETDSGLETYPSMGLSLTYDHRVIDGAQAARFMIDLINNLTSFNTLFNIDEVI